MPCRCCTCGHCVHAAPISFRPFHRPPSPPQPPPNNTLILPSTASAIDAPLHYTGRKRAHHDRDSNKTSAAFLEALYGRGGAGELAEQKQDEDDRNSEATGKEREEKQSVKQVTGAGMSAATSSTVSSSSASCRCSCHTDGSAQLISAHVPAPQINQSTRAQQPEHATPRQATAEHAKRQKAEAVTPGVATPRSVLNAHSSRAPGGRQLHIHTPLNTDTAIFKGALPLSPIPTTYTPPSPYDNKYDTADDSPVDEQLEAARSEARQRSQRRKAQSAAVTAADAARRDKLEAAFQAAQAKRAHQVRAEDAYYAAMLQKQYERRVKMDFFQQRFELHRRERRLAEGRAEDRGAASTASSRPVFVDFGGRNTRTAVDGERLLSFNITPDLPPNAPPNPQTYNSARRAATERLRQKQLVLKRVRQELDEDGVEEAGDGQSEYDRKVAAMAHRQRVQQQQHHHAQRMAAATHKPQRSSRPSTAERPTASATASSGSAYVPLLPLPMQPMASASQASYASFRPPSAQSVKLQRQRA